MVKIRWYSCTDLGDETVATAILAAETVEDGIAVMCFRGSDGELLLMIPTSKLIEALGVSE